LTKFLFLFSFAAARETVATAKSNAKREAMRFSRQQDSADAAVAAAAGPPPPDLAAERALEVQEQVHFVFSYYMTEYLAKFIHFNNCIIIVVVVAVAARDESGAQTESYPTRVNDTAW
jgi:hypothetical protein